MFPLCRPMTCAGLAAALVAFSVGVQAQPAPADASAQIRYTRYGVPHIVAKDERGLGYGVGYAYAQDNLCLLANEVLTVSGERSRYFGAKGKTLEQRDNLTSDLFFTWLNSPAAVDAFLQALPLVESGAAAAFALSVPELAISCASHGGEKRHVDTVAAWLKPAQRRAGSLKGGFRRGAACWRASAR